MGSLDAAKPATALHGEPASKERFGGELDQNNSVEGRAVQASNRLPILAADIKSSHNQIHKSAGTILKHAVLAGERLLEAKQLLAHGEWLPWLAANCELSERTARNYMRLAKNKSQLRGKSAAVADLTIRSALEELADPVRPPDCSDEPWQDFPLLGCIRIFQKETGRCLDSLFVEESIEHPGYYFYTWVHLDADGEAFIEGFRRPIKRQLIELDLSKVWDGAPSFLDIPHADFERGFFPELEREFAELRKHDFGRSHQ